MVRKSDAEAELHLPPGFRFHPTDEELVVHYLHKKVRYQGLPVPIIAEVDLYKYDPWQLPEKALFGEKEWYFFTPRDRKYPNGSRPNRTAGSGYWKATGADKQIRPAGSTRHVGIKKALVFYAGKAPHGYKTNWIMHEYRLADSSNRSTSTIGNNTTTKRSLRLDDWVLCRIYNKKNTREMIVHRPDQESSLSEETTDSSDALIDSAMDGLVKFGERQIENDPFRDLVDLAGNRLAHPSQSVLHCRDNNLEGCFPGAFLLEEGLKEEEQFAMFVQDDLQASLGLPGDFPFAELSQDWLF